MLTFLVSGTHDDDDEDEDEDEDEDDDDVHYHDEKTSSLLKRR